MKWFFFFILRRWNRCGNLQQKQWPLMSINAYYMETISTWSVRTLTTDNSNIVSEFSKQRLCDACKFVRLPLNSGEYRHIHGYQLLASLAERCDLCKIVRDGLRREFVASTPINPGDGDSINRADVRAIRKSYYGFRITEGLLHAASFPTIQ